MKRLPLLCGFMAFILLCMSLSFWGVRVFKPMNRSVADVPLKGRIEPGSGQWGGIFGGTQTAQINAANYDLKGIIIARKNEESLAIISANGKPAQTVALNSEIAPGIILKEIHEGYVMISESGVMRRASLPENTIAKISSTTARNPSNELPQVSPVAPVGFPPRASQGIPPSSNPPIVPTAPIVLPGFPGPSNPQTGSVAEK
ncbi:type II secretion system protein N [Undibacterium sp. RuRC25W]|uniref:type II secretion system protein N n=1 Tax=Undibacterium sp. RuRC25W TaxID=3413047 RepID=UPI003BF15359